MPWSSGSFTRTDGTRSGSSVWTKARNGLVKILSSDHDTHDQDMAEGINSCVNKDGSNAMTGDLDGGGNDLTNWGNFAFGTFTPTIEGTSTTGTFSYLNQLGSYSVAGDVVFVHILIEGGFSVNGTGSLVVKGLPFTPSSAFAASGGIGGAGILNAFQSGIETEAVQILAQNGRLEIMTINGIGTPENIDAATVPAGVPSLLISGQYIRA